MNDKDIIEIFSDKNGKINPNKTRLSWLDKHEDIKLYLENRYDIFYDYTTTLKFIFAGLTDVPKCEKCGKSLNNIRRWCNQKCQLSDPKFKEYRERVIDYDAKVKKTKETMLNRHGVESFTQSEKCIKASHTKEARQKAVKSNIKTCMAKYGKSNSFAVSKFREKGMKTKRQHRPNDPTNANQAMKTMEERYGHRGTMACPELVKKVKATKKERYGDENYLNSEKANQTLIDKFGENPTRFGSNGFKKNMHNKYGVDYFCQTDEFKHNRYRKYLYNDIYFDSSYELCFYKYCIDHNFNIEIEPINIEYQDETGKNHTYMPDFRVEGELVEIKGEHFFENGKMINPYDRSMDYIYEAKHQCMVNNSVKIITDCSKYLDYCGKDFIETHKVK